MLKYILIIALAFGSVGLLVRDTASAQAAPASPVTTLSSPSSIPEADAIRRQWVERVMTKYLQSDEPMVSCAKR